MTASAQPLPLERADERLDLEVKFSAPTEAGEFTGMASVFGVVDDDGDVVERGAFRASLAAHRKAGRWPSLLWMHDRTAPIGRWLDVKETAEGLEVHGKLTLGTVKGAEAYALLRDGAIDALSIGFRTVKSARTKAGRLLQEVALAEVSLVSLPALASARVTSVKSARAGMAPAVPRKETRMSEDHVEIHEPEAVVFDPAPILKQLDELQGEVKSLKADNDRLNTRLARPGAARIETKDEQAELEQRAFTQYLRKGLDGMSDLERKAMLTTDLGGSPANSGAGFTVPEQFSRELIKHLIEFSPMRQVARVVTTSGGVVLQPRRVGALAGAWVAEGQQHDTSEPTYDQVQVPIYEVRVTSEISNQLAEDSAFDLSAELARDFAEEFGRLEGRAFVMGNGTTEPEGFLMSSEFSAPDGTFDADSLIDLFHAVPSTYASRGTWLMTRAAMGAARKLKTTGTGVYLWTESLAPSNPPTILGRPVLEMPDMAVPGESPAGVSVAFGDWMAAYRIYDRIGLQVLRDPYTRARNSILAFHARRRVGGMLVKGEAVRGMAA